MRRETTVGGARRTVDGERVSTIGLVHRVLADRHRRFVLRDLVAHYHPLSVCDIVDRAVAELSDGDDERVYQRLGRVLSDEHLPLLESAGLIRSTGERVELTADGLTVARLSRACATYLDRSVVDC
ncbi:hypothetical protein [Halomarina oriensis]|uniref:ArsR family transcriptional regulator n=1 Tax=Halomarina oriensis TaxID=671145 RepID=A0A6B0GQF0_9EURY|nr:hypothetical protein [Halomarina oriensis]MWG33888.1 hypothetical protein [Halomarina oriensis]